MRYDHEISPTKTPIAMEMLSLSSFKIHPLQLLHNLWHDSSVARNHKIDKERKPATIDLRRNCKFGGGVTDKAKAPRSPPETVLFGSVRFLTPATSSA